MNRQIRIHRVIALTIVPAFAFAVIGQARAADVHLKANDTASTSSFAAAGNWDSDPAAAPCSGNNYFTSGYTLSILNGADVEFKGDSLTLDAQIWLINAKATTIPHLIAKTGGYVYTVNKKGPLYGTLELASGMSFRWNDGGSASSDLNELNMDIVGDGTTAVYHERKNGTYSKGLRLGGNLSAFEGKIYSHQTNIVMQVAFDEGKTSCPGTLECTNGARLEIEVADGIAATVGAINAADVLMKLGEGATLTVTGDVDLHGNPIRIVSAHEFTAAAETVSFVTFETATMTPSTVILEDLKAAEETGLAHCPAALNLQPVVAGGTYSLTHRRVVYQTVSDTQGSTSIFTGPGEERWSAPLDSEAAADVDYYLSQKTVYHPLTSSVEFYGNSLTLAGGRTNGVMVTGGLTTVKKITLTIADFRWLANGGDDAQISSYNGAITLNGSITVLPTPKDVYFGWYMWNGNTATINSNIRGSGGVRLTVNQDASNNANATYVLSGDNSGYTGRLLLMHKPFKKNTTPYNNPDSHFVTVKVSEQKNLGGALPEFDAEALSIEDNSLVQMTQSAVFDEPTRGWRVRGHGRIGVPENAVVVVTNKTFTYADDGVDAGRLTKEGLGTLVLGGTAAISGELDKTLEVKEGSVRFASTTAVDGLRVSFAADTSLQVDLSATGDLAAKGVLNSALEPFVCASADGKIPLTFVFAGTMPERAFAVAICTVSDTLKDVLKFGCPLKFDRRGLSVDCVDNQDGTVTFFASVADKGGVVLIVR